MTTIREYYSQQHRLRNYWSKGEGAVAHTLNYYSLGDNADRNPKGVLWETLHAMTEDDDVTLPRMEDIDNYAGEDARVKNIPVVDEDDDEKDVDADIAVVDDAAVAAVASPFAADAAAAAVVVEDDDANAVADAAVATPHHPAVLNASEWDEWVAAPS